MTTHKARVTLAMLATVLGSIGCGGGGDGGGDGRDTSAGTGAPATSTANRVDRPYLFIGTCYICGSSAIFAQQAMLDGQTVPIWTVGTDAIVIARGLQSNTTTQLGQGGYSFRVDVLEARSAVVGRIEWIDLARGRIGVLGQEVHGIGPWVSAVLDSAAGTTLTINRLVVGQRVRVFGFDTDGGPIAATGVHAALADSPERVTGTVSRIDLASRQLVIGALSIDYSAAGIEAFPGGEVQVGDRIEAVGRVTDAPRLLRATNLVYREAPLAIAAGTLVGAHGVLALPSRTRSPGVPLESTVRLGGVVLSLAPSCTRELAGATNHADLYAAVNASGALQPDGESHSSCRLLAGSPASGLMGSVTGTLDPREAASGVLRVFDVAVQTQVATVWFEAGNVAGESARFRSGDTVTISLWPGVDPGRGVAAGVYRADTPIEAPALVRFEGWMTSPGPDAVTFLGRTIRIDSQTRAGLRDCSTPEQILTPVAPASFVARAFAPSSRAITATVATTDDGGWRAVTIETWNYYYCD